MPTTPPIRIVLAKIGLDGHDRGVKVVARGLRDAGFHVIYAGLWQTPEAVVRTVADEDAAWLGLSLLSGAHMTLVPRVLQLLREQGLTHVGVGKSTLIGKLIEHIRGQGQTVAVLACDPESPLTGGALLGDRFRMPHRPDDPGVFIRSLAATSGEGAVARHLPEMTRLLQAFGFDVILIETVGAGQGDTAIGALADVVVLLLQPETGDDLQWEKAGLL